MLVDMWTGKAVLMRSEDIRDMMLDSGEKVIVVSRELG